MRLTFPNPLGPPVTFDTSKVSNIRSLIPSTSTFLHRRGQLRLVLVLVIILTLLGVQPSPPFPPSYRLEWKQESDLPWAFGGARLPEGREGRYLK